MSHLIFDRRDWKFLLFEHLDVQQLLKFEDYQDFDAEILASAFDEGVKFAVERVALVNESGDRQGCRVEGGRVTTPDGYAALWKEFRDAGWIAMVQSAEFGGQGLPVTIGTGIMEAMNAACQAFYMYSGLSSEAANLIETYGNDTLRRTYVEKMYSGEWGGTMCLTEPQAGTAVGDLTTSAVPQDDGSYLIEGNKIFISGGDADFYGNVAHLVLARIKGDPAGTRGISLFVVPRHLPDEKGNAGEYNNVYVEGIEHKMGINGSATCQISFGQRGPTRGFLVGQAMQGLPYMFQMMNHARIACGIQGSSLANAAYQQALAYARDRRQGPDLENLGGSSVEIIRHPDVKRNLLLMKAWAEGTRALLAQGALWGDIAKSSPDEAQRARAQDLIDLVTPIAKAYSTDKGFKVTELAIQVFGGYGYCRDYPVEQYMRDCKIASLYEGTNGVQALDLVGRKLRQKGGALFMTYIMELGGFIEANQGNELLAGTLKSLQKAQESLGNVAFWMSSTAKANIRLAMLQATPFLELFGDVMVGHMLAAQAVTATNALKARGFTALPTADERRADADVAFYAAKIDTARFFANEVLLWAPSKARSMTSGDTSALDVVF